MEDQELVIRPFSVLRDYACIKRWWAAHKWQSVPVPMLPKTGLVAEASDKPLAAGFIYSTDSGIAWLEWIVSDPQSDKLVRNKALNALIDALVKLAGERGFKAVFTSSNHPKLMERYQELGFAATDQGVTHFLRRL
jgi:hypothetical protein